MLTTAVAFPLLLLTGLPVAFVLLGTALVLILVSGSFAMVESVPMQMFSSLQLFDLLAIPLFVLLGEVMNEGGITRRLFDAARAWLAWIPRSLAFVNLLTNLMLASILGSANAQIAVMSRVAVPEMEKSGYRRDYATALTAAAGLLGPIIPPSMFFIIFAVVAQVSIGSMFLGGIVPGLLLFAGIAAVILLLPKGSPSPTAKAPPSPARGHVTRDALMGLLVPVAVVASILGGVVTPTESAALATALAIAVGGLYYRELGWAQLPAILDRTATNSALVMLLIVTAKVFGWTLTYFLVPQAVATGLQALTSDPVVFMGILVVLLLVVGCVMEGIAALIILVPILLPVARSAYGIDPIHFGIVMSITLILGLLTPPVGSGLYIASAVTGVSLGRLTRALTPFLLVTMAVIVALILAPELVLVLL